MSNSIMFSIIVPVYNVMDYIDECIQSVLSQSYKQYELILADDGSTDQSGKIIDQYAEKYPQIKVFHKENEGSYHTRRFAIEHASGDYYVMLDSDDMLDGKCLETLYNAIIKHNCDCVFFNRRKLTNGKTEHAIYHIEEGYVTDRHSIIRKALIDIPYNSFCLKCAKSGMYSNHIFSQYYKINKGEDALQTLELLTGCNTAEFIDDELYIYRQRSGSICHPTDQTEYEVDLTVREVCLQFIREQNCFSEEDMNAYRDKYILYYLNHITLIGSMNMSTAKKKDAYNKLRNEKYYTDFLSKGITNKKTIGSKVVLWYLFEHKYDTILIKLLSVYNHFSG